MWFKNISQALSGRCHTGNVPAQSGVHIQTIFLLVEALLDSILPYFLLFSVLPHSFASRPKVSIPQGFPEPAFGQTLTAYHNLSQNVELIRHRTTLVECTDSWVEGIEIKDQIKAESEMSCPGQRTSNSR